MRRSMVSVWVVLLLLVTMVPSASAQPLGTFQWQFAPFCNVITVSVTQMGSTFTLDGFDDQCGAATRAAIVGTAFPNPNGTIGIGLSLVATPGAAPVHVDVALNLATIGGPWRDSFGNTGTFVFSPPSPAPGAPRPATGGLISTVTPGVGLTGGGTTGAVSLAVTFNGSGAADSAARSDHTHAVTGFANTAIGAAALGLVSTGGANTAAGAFALNALTTGGLNTGVGRSALSSLATGGSNTAVGANSLGDAVNTAGNTAVGSAALSSTLANGNTGVGASALLGNANGARNTAVGQSALIAVEGDENIGIGWSSGAGLLTGNNNIYLGSAAAALNESNTMRLGAAQTATHIAGVFLANVDGLSDIPVLVDSSGKIGTNASSARFKQDIRPLGGMSSSILRLEPVMFRYTPEQGRGLAQQYGLIAEQVAEVMPDLVVRDAQGQPTMVKYQVLPTLLLAEVQRLERERAAQAKEIQELREQVQALLQRQQ